MIGFGSDKKYPIFTEILGKPPIFDTFQESYIKPKQRKTIWAEKIIIGDLVYTVLSWIKSAHHLHAQMGRGEGGAGGG